MDLKRKLLNLIFPVTCLGCSHEGDWLCDICFKKLRFPGPPHNLQTPYLDQLYLAGDYQDELLAVLIKNFKFQSLPAIGEKLGLFLSLFWQGTAYNLGLSRLANEPKSPIPSVIPIPLSKKRQRQRGFNQAEILARCLSESFGYPLCLDLKRIGHQKPQSSLDEKQRTYNVSGAFGWQGENLDKQTIILVDDVATTGATLNEAARILKESGAARIYGLALAKG